MSDLMRNPAIAPDSEPSLAVGPQWPDGHVLEGALVLEYIRDRIPDAPHDLVVVYDDLDACVILQGTLRGEEMRQRILRVAADVPGVVRLDDRMTVAR